MQVFLSEVKFQSSTSSKALAKSTFLETVYIYCDSSISIGDDSIEQVIEAVSFLESLGKDFF